MGEIIGTLEAGSLSKGLGKTDRPPPAVRADRLTVVDNVYFVGRDGPGDQFSSRFDRELKSGEQVYHRVRQVAGPVWRPLDLGWCADCGVGMILVRNDEGKFAVAPTEEEREEMSRRVLLVGDYSHPWRVLPGESMRGLPSFVPSVRSETGGPVQYSVVVVPA